MIHRIRAIVERMRPSAWWPEQRWTVVAGASWAFAIALLLYRLPYGASNTDEPFYSAMPYSFLLGNRPWVNELGVFQNAGLLLLPFYRVYVAIAGSAAGIVLFNRYLYVIWLVICSIASFAFVRRISTTTTACCVAALVVGFSYFNLFALSYNTCGAFSFLCGILCTAYAVSKGRPGKALFCASLLLLAAMFAHPSLTPAVAVYSCILLHWLFRVTRREARNNALLGFAAGALVALTTAVALAARLGRTGLARLLAFSQGMGYGTQGPLQRLNVFHSMEEHWHWFIVGFAALFVALPVLCVWLKRSLWPAVALTVLGFGFVYWRGLAAATPTTSTILLTALPVLAPICAVLNPTWEHRRFVLRLIWAPSLVAMLTIAYTSSNWYQSASLGVLGALIAGITSFSALLDARSARDPSRRSGYQLVFAAFFGTLFVMECHTWFTSFYADDAHFSHNQTRVRTGPQRGTFTTSEQAKFLESIDRDLKTAERDNPTAKTLTIFDDFPTGYLSTRLKPLTFTHWIIWGFLPAEYAHAAAKQTWGTRAQLPDLLLEVHENPIGRVYWEAYFRHRYRPIIRRPEYDYMILRRIDTPHR
ncbi:MAG: hypothetical protein ABI548_27500 [Polyangiaceae bacterium]